MILLKIDNYTACISRALRADLGRLRIPAGLREQKVHSGSSFAKAMRRPSLGSVLGGTAMSGRSLSGRSLSGRSVLAAPSQRRCEDFARTDQSERSVQKGRRKVLRAS